MKAIAEILREAADKIEAIPADKDPEQVKPWEQPCPKCGGPHWSTNCPTSEPVKRREWTLHRHELNDFARISDGSEFPHSKRIRVREVLPGDPKQEQVEELVGAGVQAIKRLRAFRLVDDELESALQPFTGKEPK